MVLIRKENLRKILAEPVSLALISLATILMVSLAAYMIYLFIQEEAEEQMTVNQLHEEYRNMHPIEEREERILLLTTYLDENESELTTEDRYSVYIQLGNAYYMTDQYDQAIDAYDQAEKVAGEEIFASSARQGFGDVARKQGDYSQAIAYYEEAINLLNQELESIEQSSDVDGARQIDLAHAKSGLEALVKSLEDEL